MFKLMSVIGDVIEKVKAKDPAQPGISPGR